MTDYRPCWFKLALDKPFQVGRFHKWSESYEEFETGPGNFGAAIVEDQKGAIHLIHAELVRFSPPEPEQVREPEVYPHAGRVMTAEEQKMLKEPGFFISPPEPESMMFKPKYFRINDTWHMFLVRPDVGELFTVSEVSAPLKTTEIARACQVQWISGRVVCSQGGIPLREIKTIFEEVNSN